jgi:hypothetical protein
MSERWHDPFQEAELRVDMFSNISGAAARITNVLTDACGESAWEPNFLAARDAAMEDLRHRMPTPQTGDG